MTADPKRPTGPPPSAGVLARYAQAYARELGVAEGRVRAWVAYMILAGVLERATDADAPRFIVKGGVALELRLRDRARATKDIDIVLRDTKADLAGTLEQALTGEAYQGFSFRRKGQPLLLENGAVNMEFAITYRGQPWTSISVDIARAEAGESEVEWVEAIALTDAFGVTGPALLPCLPLRFHVAQKLHGLTLPPRPGKQNERFRDLVDLLLMEALVTHDYVALREACELVFRSCRRTHPWPPDLAAMPSHWTAFRATRPRTRAGRNGRRDGAREGPRLRRSHPQFIVVDPTESIAIHRGLMVARQRPVMHLRTPLSSWSTEGGGRRGGRKARARLAPLTIAACKPASPSNPARRLSRAL